MSQPTFRDLDYALAQSISAYAELRAEAERDLGDQDFDHLLSRCDEYGVQHVVSQPGVSDQLRARLTALGDAQDRIDDALAARESVARAQHSRRDARISVQGEVYRIDEFERDQPALIREHVEPPSMTEALARDRGTTPALPQPDQNRSRGR